MKQEQPPDSHEWAGGDEPDDGAAGVGGGEFAAECIADGVWGAELGDRGRGGLVGW